MLKGANLRKTAQGWQFASEAALEDFVWVNLKQLLKMTPLKRQYSVKGQFCDILAVDENNRLVVLELKNAEDRYIVQQLTRYHKGLLEEKPFQEEIDYEQPVKLVAIKPNFHRDNLTDRDYHKLNFIFLQFEITQDQEQFYFQLKDIDNYQCSRLKILPKDIDSTEDLPNPPRALLNLLSKFSDSDSQVLLQIRQKLLSFDKLMLETSASEIISYGKGKSKPCAQFRGSKVLPISKGLVRPSLILWLPISPWRDDYKRIGRMVISNKSLPRHSILSEIDEYSYIAYMPKKTRYDSYHQSWSVKDYIKILKKENDFLSLDNLDCLDFLVDIALEEWSKRL